MELIELLIWGFRKDPWWFIGAFAFPVFALFFVFIRAIGALLK